MIQLKEYSAFNISKISKHEKDLNVLSNEEMLTIIELSLNFDIVVQQKHSNELIERLTNNEDYSNIKEIKVIIDPLNKYMQIEEMAEDIKYEINALQDILENYTLNDNEIEDIQNNILNKTKELYEIINFNYYKQLKNVLKKYTHYTLLNFVVNKYNEKKETYLNKAKQLKQEEEELLKYINFIKKKLSKDKENKILQENIKVLKALI
jgi:hypothetical protein